MERLLNQAAEGKANRFAKWYVLAHTARCGPCRRFLERLEAMLASIKAARKASEPSPEALERLMRDFESSETRD